MLTKPTIGLIRRRREAAEAETREMEAQLHEALGLLETAMCAGFTLDWEPEMFSEGVNSKPGFDFLREHPTRRGLKIPLRRLELTHAWFRGAAELLEKHEARKAE